MTSNAVILYRFQHIIYGFISGTYSCRLQNVLWSVFNECSSCDWPFSKLNVTAGEVASIVSGGNTENRELLNEELEGETGDGARSNSWIFNISLFTL